MRDFLPQVALLERAALLVTHGGNNSVTEALTAGVPMVVLPFSTDQFAGAAAVEAAGLGAALDPNTATSADLASAVRARSSTATPRSWPARSAKGYAGHRAATSPGPPCVTDRRTARRGTHDSRPDVVGTAVVKRAARCGGGAAGNRTPVLERRTRSSPGAVSDVAFLGPGARTDTSPTGPVRIESRSPLLTESDQQVP